MTLQMASNGSKVGGLFWVLGYMISLSGSILVLCGLAAMQNLCYTGNACAEPDC